MKFYCKSLMCFIGCILATLFIGGDVKASEVPTIMQTDGDWLSYTVTCTNMTEDTAIMYRRTDLYGNNEVMDDSYGPYMDMDIIPGKKYLVSACFWDWSEDTALSDWSNPITVVTGTKEDVAPYEISHTSTSVSIGWKDIGADEYQVRLSTISSDFDQYQPYYTTSTSMQLTGLKESSNFWITIVPIMKSDKFTCMGYTSEPLCIWTSSDNNTTIGDKDQTGNTGTTTIPIDYSVFTSTTPKVLVSKRDYMYGNVQFGILNNGVKFETFEYQVADYKGKVFATGTSDHIASVYNSKITKYNMFKIRARLKIGTMYSKWSAWTVECRNPNLKMKKSGGSYKMSWKKVKNAKDYLVYVSTKPDRKFKKIATTKKTSYSITKYAKKTIKSGKKYYFYVVPRFKVGSKKVATQPSYIFNLYQIFN